METHPRFHMHWRSVFKSVSERSAAIGRYIAAHNKKPEPFVWTAKANDILQKVIRANRRSPKKTRHYTMMSASNAKPAPMSNAPATWLRRSPPGTSFSTSTYTASAMIHQRFIRPPIKSSSISPQQQATQ